MRPTSAANLPMDYTIEITLTDQVTRSVISTGPGQQTDSQQATTPDKTSGILTCLEASAFQLGCSSRDLLRQTKTVTLAVPELVSEMLAAKTGSRVGLIVSKGYETTAYGRDSAPNLAGSLVVRELIVGIAEEINEQGQPILLPDSEEVKARFRQLLELGSGIIVVSFKHASLNPAHEQLLQAIMRADYPRHYLGAVPVLLASDFSRAQDDEERTNIALLNAYTWFGLDQTLRRVETTLRRHGYGRGLLITQTAGSAVSIPRVTPLRTSGGEEPGELDKYYRLVRRDA